MSEETAEIVKPRGRPPGTSESVPDIYERQLLQLLKLNQEMVNEVKACVKDKRPFPEESRVLWAEIRKAIVDFSKPVVAPAKSDGTPKADTEDPEKILRDLTGGGR